MPCLCLLWGSSKIPPKFHLFNMWWSLVLSESGNAVRGLKGDPFNPHAIVYKGHSLIPCLSRQQVDRPRKLTSFFGVYSFVICCSTITRLARGMRATCAHSELNSLRWEASSAKEANPGCASKRRCVKMGKLQTCDVRCWFPFTIYGWSVVTQVCNGKHFLTSTSISSTMLCRTTKQQLPLDIRNSSAQAQYAKHAFAAPA